jgi:hypothetical protein
MSTVKCALVTIVKSENHYIEEYCDYYLRLGFTHIILYDNSDINDMAYLTRINKNILVIRFPGMGKQIPAYNHFIKHYKQYYDYVAFFDADEFLVLKKHRTIGEFCLEYIPEGALGVNWYIFGNNNKQRYESDLVIRRFTKRAAKMDPHVKTIAKCSDLRSMMIHHPLDLSGKGFYNTKKQLISGPFNHNTDDSIVQLNHYMTKSNEELVDKIKRGRAPSIFKRKIEELLPYLSMNDVEDTSALDFYMSTYEKETVRV